MAWKTLAARIVGSCLGLRLATGGPWRQGGWIVGRLVVAELGKSLTEMMTLEGVWLGQGVWRIVGSYHVEELFGGMATLVVLFWPGM